MTTSGTVYIKNESVKDRVHNEEAKRDLKKLDTLSQETESVVYQLSSVFPFQIFPDKIIIDKNKVTIVRKGLLMKRIFPILIEDIMTVKVNRGPFFASLEFEVRGYEQNPRSTNFLWPSEASHAEQLILGLVKAKRDGLDLTKLTTSQVEKRVEGIGGADEEATSVF